MVVCIYRGVFSMKLPDKFDWYILWLAFGPLYIFGGTVAIALIIFVIAGWTFL